MASEKITQAVEMLQEGVQDLFESEKYRRYLDTMSRFHDYSVNNMILIGMQRPDATLVAGYTSWRDKFHRSVKKGEKGITIISPSPYKVTREVEKTDPDGTTSTEEQEISRIAFRTATVFDVSQTEGEPLPEIVTILYDPVEDFDDLLDAIKAVSPVPVSFEQIKGSANGYYTPKEAKIVIKRGMPEEQTLKTLLHEVGHATLGHGGKDDHLDRRTREVQAESVAYVVSKAIGLDTEDYSFGYVAGWSSNRDLKELKSSLQTIRDAADKLITGIEEKLDIIREQRMEKEIKRAEVMEMKQERGMKIS